MHPPKQYVIINQKEYIMTDKINRVISFFINNKIVELQNEMKVFRAVDFMLLGRKMEELNYDLKDYNEVLRSTGNQNPYDPFQMRKACIKLHDENYIYGINNDKWFDAWGLVFDKISKGEKYTEEMANECYKELHGEKE